MFFPWSRFNVFRSKASRKGKKAREFAAEQLEIRHLLTTYTVNTILDAPDDDASVTNGYISLREAINAASTNTAFGDAPAGTNEVDIIRFSDPLKDRIIYLGGTELTLSGEIQIEGPGSEHLKISGGNLSRIIKVEPRAKVEISGLTLTGGNADTGGAIDNLGGLTLREMRLTGNQAVLGGAVSNRSNPWNYYSMKIFDSTIDHNNATDGGGAIFSTGYTRIQNSSFFENTSLERGGALFNLHYTILASSAVYQNSSTSHGGAVYNAGTISISNSTISSNISNGTGGGVYNAEERSIQNNENDSWTVLTKGYVNEEWNVEDPGYPYPDSSTYERVYFYSNQSTIVYNHAVESGGINPAHLTQIQESIIAGNTAGSDHAPSDIPGEARGFPVTATSTAMLMKGVRTSIVGDTETAGGAVNGEYDNVVGVNVRDVIDGVLRNNGGATPTHALVENSPALNRGDRSSYWQSQYPTYDQRGTGYPRILDGREDRGAFEGFIDPSLGIYETLRKKFYGDFNGDGFQDVAIWLLSGEWKIGAIGSDGEYNFSTWTTWEPVEVKEVHVGDFNQDGKDDIIGLFRTGRDGRWWVALSDGTRFLNRSWGTFSYYDNIDEILVGNFDGVKGDDLAVISANRNLWLAKSSNSQFQMLYTRIWKGVWWENMRFTQVGDYNGDGRDDIVTVYEDKSRSRYSDAVVYQRTLMVAIGAGPVKGFTSRNYSELSVDKPLNSLLVGDFNGDGKDDVAARIEYTKWWVGITSQNRFVFRHWTNWAFAGRSVSALHVGDTNRDGLSDLVGRDANGTWISAESTGSRFRNRVVDPASVNYGQPAVMAAQSEEQQAADLSQWAIRAAIGSVSTPAEEKRKTIELPILNGSDEKPSPLEYEAFGETVLLEMLHSS